MHSLDPRGLTSTTVGGGTSPNYAFCGLSFTATIIAGLFGCSAIPMAPNERLVSDFVDPPFIRLYFTATTGVYSDILPV